MEVVEWEEVMDPVGMVVMLEDTIQMLVEHGKEVVAVVPLKAGVIVIQLGIIKEAVMVGEVHNHQVNHTVIEISHLKQLINLKVV